MQLRYEDLVAGPTDLFDRVADLVGVPASTWEDRGGLHGGSLRRWSTDPAFGFSLHPDVVRSAGSFGYDEDELRNPQASRSVALPSGGAPLRRRLRRSPRLERPRRSGDRSATVGQPPTTLLNVPRPCLGEKSRRTRPKLSDLDERSVPMSR